MDNKELFELMDRFEKSGIFSMEVETEEFAVKFQKTPPAPVVPAPAAAPAAPVAVAVAAASAPAQDAPAGDFVKAPLVGTFYSASAPGEAPYASVGMHVSKGKPLCLIEAMKTMNEIPAPCDLVVEEILLRDGDLAAFDAPILRYSHV